MVVIREQGASRYDDLDEWAHDFAVLLYEIYQNQHKNGIMENGQDETNDVF